jgi:hypothetical protein
MTLYKHIVICNASQTTPIGGDMCICLRLLAEPKWLIDKAQANKPIGDVVFIGKMGVDGVYDGKLPSGENYVYQKRVDKVKRKIYE